MLWRSRRTRHRPACDHEVKRRRSGNAVLIVRENIDETRSPMPCAWEPGRSVAGTSRPAIGRTASWALTGLERALSTTSVGARIPEQLQNFLEAPPTPSLTCKEGIIVDANRAWLELFGYSATTR